MRRTKRLSTLGFRGSAAEKLARILLARADSMTSNDGTIRAFHTLTHEEIAEMIGASRETVTRLFASFKKKKLIEVHGSSLVIKSKGGLETLLGLRPPPRPN